MNESLNSLYINLEHKVVLKPNCDSNLDKSVSKLSFFIPTLINKQII